MSPASYLAAPPRVAAVIVAPSLPASIAPMWTWIYLAALVIFVVVFVAGGALVAVRALRFWRDFGAVRGVVFTALDRLADAADHAAQRAAELSADDRLPRALARLRRSNARLAVLRAALAEVQDSIAAVTVWYPRK
jgi:hypothetical protein